MLLNRCRWAEVCFCGSSDYCVSCPYADRWGRSECSKCTAVQGAPMGPASSPESPSGPVKNGWGRGICITAWRPSPHCCTHVHSMEQQHNKAALCTAGLITHSGPEREPRKSKKAVMESRLQIKVKMEIPKWKCKVPQTPSVPWQHHSWVIYTWTVSGHFLHCSLLAVTLLSNGIHRKPCHGHYFSHNAYKDPCKHLCRCSSDAARMPKGLSDVCFHLEDVIC